MRVTERVEVRLKARHETHNERTLAIFFGFLLFLAFAWAASHFGVNPAWFHLATFLVFFAIPMAIGTWRLLRGIPEDEDDAS